MPDRVKYVRHPNGRRAMTWIKGLGVEATGPTVSGWPVEALGEVEEPETSSNEPGDEAFADSTLRF